MKRFGSSILAAAVLGLTSGLAQAATVGMNVYNDTKAGGVDLSQIGVSIDVIDSGSTYDFTFTNTSTILSSLTKVYFDNSLASVLSGGPTISNGAGVDMRTGGAMQNPPFAVDLGWTGSLAYLRSDGSDDATKIANGAADGGVESFTVSFAKVGGTLLQDVLDLLASTGGIAAHVVHLNGQGITTNVNLTTLALQTPGGEQHPSQAIPTPASAAAGIALMGLLASRRRRNA